jgi:hypothetical protein
MIALPDNTPLVQFEGGQVCAFERQWLVRSLERAARKAGYPQWWLAEHVAESVSTYLQFDGQENVVAVPRLTQAVQAALQVIGYAEVANHFVPGPPPHRISLWELARAAGSGYELAFFELLGRTIQETVSSKVSHFELIGLERCVKQLRGKKLWSRDCDALRAEIVNFVREQIGIASPVTQEIAFSLS